MVHRFFLAFVMLLALAFTAHGQSTPTFVPLGPAKGALYRPDTPNADTAHVGVLLAHRSGNFMTHIGARELSRRGFVVLAMNTRFENNEPNVMFDQIALDISAGMNHLRRQPGITKVVLFGHSGGAATMSFYQALAEKGADAATGPTRVVPGEARTFARVAPADGLILVDPHPGVSVNLLRALDPRITDEGAPNQLDASLDPLNPAHGYNPNGPTKYHADFVERYHRAQSARMNRLIEKALALQKKIDAGEHTVAQDDLFLVPRGSGGGLRSRDFSIYDYTRSPRPLLKNDGTLVMEAVSTVRPPAAPATRPAASPPPFSSTRQFTVRSFLATFAVRSIDSLEGIDWASTNNSVPNNVKNVTVPLLVAAMGAHTFLRDSEIIFEAAASGDKQFIIIEGATHDMVPYRPAGNPDQYGNVTPNFFNHVAQWITKHFPAAL